MSRLAKQVAENPRLNASFSSAHGESNAHFDVSTLLTRDIPGLDKMASTILRHAARSVSYLNLLHIHECSFRHLQVRVVPQTSRALSSSAVIRKGTLIQLSPDLHFISLTRHRLRSGPLHQGAQGLQAPSSCRSSSCHNITTYLTLSTLLGQRCSRWCCQDHQRS